MAKKVLAVVLSTILLLSVLNLNVLLSVLAADNYITVLKQGFEGNGITEYYSQKANGYNNDYRSVEIVTGEGIGNNGSNTAIKLGFGRDIQTTDEGNNKPSFNICSSDAYNGRNPGESFRFKPGTTYKLSFYYKIVSAPAELQLWANQIQGSLETTRVDLMDSAAYKKLVEWTKFTTNDYVYVETEMTALEETGYDLVFMIRQKDFAVNGVTVYIDDITVKEKEEQEIVPGSGTEPEYEYEYDEVLTTTFETDAEVKANSGFYCGTSNAAAHALDSAGYKYKNYDNISGAASGQHMTIPVVQNGIGNNGSKGVMKLGYDGNASGASQYRPVFSLRCSEAYNGRNVGQSFQTVANSTYKVSFYYKAETINTPVSLWMRTYNGSLTNAAVDSNSDSVKLIDISAATDGYVHVEAMITATKKENLVIFMKSGDYSKVGGTAVYIDDVTVYLEKKTLVIGAGGTVLSATFEDYSTDGKDYTYYMGSNKFANGVAPIFGSNNIPNDPRETYLVTGTGVGYNGSNGAIKFGYKNNPDNTNKAGLPVFSVRSSQDYNGRNNTQSFRLVAGQIYTLSFYYKAENISTPIDMYMREYDKSLQGARLDINDSARPATKLASITESTDGWRKVEIEITGVAGQDMVFLMKPTDFTSLAGTAVYIDNITLTLPVGLSKIKFETNGGGTIPARDVRPDNKFGALPVPVKNGYVFEGWFNQDYTVAYTEDMICPKDIDGTTFYAKWSKISDEVKSFSTSFEESEYSVTPYLNDGTAQNMHNNITLSSSWFKNSELSYSGSGAMRISNDPFYMYNGKITHGFSLVNDDGTRFNVVEGKRYKIKFYYYATEPATAHSHISAIISSDNLAKNAVSSQQVVCKKTVHGISDDWQEVEATFEANVTGFVYITLTARISTSEASSRYHTTYVDNVSVELLDSEYVKVTYYDGTSLKSSSIGKNNDTLTHPILEVKAGYEFTGWYKDAECTERVTESVYPSVDTKYYAGYVSTDNLEAVASDTTGKVMSFEENEVLDAFYGTKQRLTKDIDDMGREIEFIKNDPDNARTGNNYIKMSELEYHYSEIGLLLYDPNNENGNLYLEPGESYSISYWVLPNDAFNVLQFSIALTDVSNEKFAVKNTNKLDIQYVDPNEYEEGEWIKVTHTVTNTSDYLRSVALVAPKEGNNCFIDDVSVNKMVDVQIKFDSNGGSEVEAMTIKTYSLAEVVFEPIRDGFEFVGWCIDKELTKLFDFENTEITGPMTLYAKWKADEVLIEDEEDDFVDEDFSIDVDSDSVIDETYDDLGNGERPVIDSADPVKHTSNTITKVVEENNSVNPIVIAAIICGGVLLAAGLFVLILLLRKKRNKTIVGG